MNNIFFSNAGSVIFRCIFREKIIFAFWQKGNFIFVGQRNITFTNIQKTSYFHVFFEKYHLSFSVRKKNIIFSGKRNAIFPYDIRKIIFQPNFFGKTIFSEHLKNISYFHAFFWERSSFIFRLKNKIIFSGKRNIIFPDDTRKIIFQCNFLEIPSLQNISKNKIWFFVQWEELKIHLYGQHGQSWVNEKNIVSNLYNEMTIVRNTFKDKDFIKKIKMISNHIWKQ